ncbi:hypothetical protein BJ878DRAFT_130783 [Calycina marina]|uniref:Uncharacterized protein n=1 Tax=Calycina marina TaxID=1763456 RepID=A0A9P7Z068_9HELO|nr:hypothetical protein BJ878DRAFT_130783 [Calycina marina]
MVPAAPLSSRIVQSLALTLISVQSASRTQHSATPLLSRNSACTHATTSLKEKLFVYLTTLWQTPFSVPDQNQLSTVATCARRYLASLKQQFHYLAIISSICGIIPPCERLLMIELQWPYCARKFSHCPFCHRPLTYNGCGHFIPFHPAMESQQWIPDGRNIPNNCMGCVVSEVSNGYNYQKIQTMKCQQPQIHVAGSAELYIIETLLDFIAGLQDAIRR